MGRPRRQQQPVVHQVKLVLIPGEDDDLIQFFDGLPARSKSAAVKGAMRSGNLGLKHDGDDDAIEAALDQFLI